MNLEEAVKLGPRPGTVPMEVKDFVRYRLESRSRDPLAGFEIAGVTFEVDLTLEVFACSQSGGRTLIGFVDKMDYVAVWRAVYPFLAGLHRA